MKRLAIAALISAAMLPAVAAQEADEQPADVALEEGEAGPDSGDELAEEEEPSGPTYNKYQMATLRALDKITGRSTDFEIETGEPMIFGALEVDLKVCYQTPPEEPPESAAFLQIRASDALMSNTITQPRLASEVKQELADAASARRSNEPSGDGEPGEMLFSGWMFASSPGLSALEHPVYDVWVIRCRQPSPESLSSPAVPDE